MTVRELITHLESIAQEHGDDVPVLHHDDWNDFVVDTVRFEPASEVDCTGTEWRVPAHIVLDSVCPMRMLDGKGGFE